MTREVHSVEETWALAKEVAATLRPGDVVCLEGDLGAGKTTFTQGLAKALGVEGRVTSPTFCIVQEHRAKSPAPGRPGLLVHMDLYRLHGEDDVFPHVSTFGHGGRCGARGGMARKGGFADTVRREAHRVSAS